MTRDSFVDQICDFEHTDSIRKRLYIPSDYVYSEYITEVMKTGSANLNFLCNFSQLPLPTISLFTVLFTADVGLFLFFYKGPVRRSSFLLACFLVRDLFTSGCRHN